MAGWWRGLGGGAALRCTRRRVPLVPSAERLVAALKDSASSLRHSRRLQSPKREDVPAPRVGIECKHEFRVPEHSDVCVVRGDQDLALFADIAEHFHHFVVDVTIVEVVLRLIND